MTGPTTEPRSAARPECGVHLDEQVALPGLLLTAAARVPSPCTARERCELLLHDDGGCTFALGHLDDAQVDALRRRARAGATPAEVLAALRTQPDPPARLLVGTVHGGTGSRALSWARCGTQAPRLVSPDRVRQAEESSASDHALGELELGPAELLVLSSAAAAPASDAALLAATAGRTEGDACSRLLALAGLGEQSAAVLTVSAAASPAHDAAHPAAHLAADPTADPTDDPTDDPVQDLVGLHDPLTGLPGPALALDRLRQAARGLDRLSSGIVLLGVALAPRQDAAALRRAADQLTHALRPGDTAARWRGDVLLAVCTQVDDLAAADALASRARSRLQAAVPGAHVAAMVLWEAPSDAELDALPDRVAWLARRSGDARPVLELELSSA